MQNDRSEGASPSQPLPAPVPLVTVRCHGALNDFLPHAQRGRPVTLPWSAHETVKHVVEVAGVPHPEIGALTINGAPASFGARVAPGAVIDVFSPEEAPPDGVPLRPPLAVLRFACDVHLGRLAAYLRMLGFDTRYRNDQSDAELVALARAEERVLLTRDVRLLMRGAVVHGAFVRATDPEAQVREVARRFGLRASARPFRRCMRCNGLTAPVAKAEIIDQLQPKTRRYYDEFWRCQDCGRIYWCGSHVKRMQELIDRALTG
ncbi:MAG: Mut7-C RNAse domain-containing protein [Oscillochloridaceae bacterium]|nr:Mut7-C ubiquitin/RNAse domain-containing protein [Chloroflexaceae bacterium]MDW8389073.1 Mut7-C RNAse domain-containing protein [Oscillochloridaceae bacterium]